MVGSMTSDQTNCETIPCDDAGKNKALEKLCIQEQLGINFEYTRPGKPQFNVGVERKFATLYGCVRTMLNAARLPKDFRECVWAEAAKYATEVENVMTTKPIAALHQFYGITNPKVKVKKLFGEMEIVKHMLAKKYG
jgi:hypothetical protein